MNSWTLKDSAAFGEEELGISAICHISVAHGQKVQSESIVAPSNEGAFAVLVTLQRAADHFARLCCRLRSVKRRMAYYHVV